MSNTLLRGFAPLNNHVRAKMDALEELERLLERHRQNGLHFTSEGPSLSPAQLACFFNNGFQDPLPFEYSSVLARYNGLHIPGAREIPELGRPPTLGPEGSLSPYSDPDCIHEIFSEPREIGAPPHHLPIFNCWEGNRLCIHLDRPQEGLWMTGVELEFAHKTSLFDSIAHVFRTFRTAIEGGFQYPDWQSELYDAVSWSDYFEMAQELNPRSKTAWASRTRLVLFTDGLFDDDDPRKMSAVQRARIEQKHPD
ncbi:MAG: hypothetical protein AAF869_05305 [Pseudomonadota bacterium]